MNSSWARAISSLYSEYIGSGKPASVKLLGEQIAEQNCLAGVSIFIGEQLEIADRKVGQ